MEQLHCTLLYSNPGEVIQYGKYHLQLVSLSNVIRSVNNARTGMIDYNHELHTTKPYSEYVFYNKNNDFCNKERCPHEMGIIHFKSRAVFVHIRLFYLLGAFTYKVISITFYYNTWNKKMKSFLLLTSDLNTTCKCLYFIYVHLSLNIPRYFYVALYNFRQNHWIFNTLTMQIGV